MPWEQRGKSCRFYRTKKVGTQIKRIYFGRGEAAYRAAAEDIRHQSQTVAPG